MDALLIAVCGGMFLAIPVGMLVADWRNQRRRRRAADAHTRLWADEWSYR